MSGRFLVVVRRLLEIPSQFLGLYLKVAGRIVCTLVATPVLATFGLLARGVCFTLT